MTNLISQSEYIVVINMAFKRKKRINQKMIYKNSTQLHYKHSGYIYIYTKMSSNIDILILENIDTNLLMNINVRV